MQYVDVSKEIMELAAENARLRQERDRLREFVSEVAGLDCHRYTKPFDVQPGCYCLTCAARAALAATGDKHGPSAPEAT